MTGRKAHKRGAWARTAGAQVRAAAWAALATLIFAGQAIAQETRFDFTIASGSADAVLNEIADRSGVFILYPFDQLRDVRSPGVVGRYSVRDALFRALEGSGFQSKTLPSGAIVIESESSALAASPPPQAVAQGERGRAPAPEEAAPESITVTGSRVRRPGMSTPTPVTALTTEEFEFISPRSLISVLEQLPQFVNNSTPDTALGWSGSVGQSLLNLRGIGSNRTLILLDGRRVVSSTRRGTVDIGIFPEALLDRVEIVTGGASAAYGSDAVAGVANMILDTGFQGVRGHLQAGMSERGDYEHGEASISAGVALGERTHLLASFDVYRNDGIDDLSDREWHRSYGLIRGSAGGPRWIIAPDVGSSEYSYGGLIPSGPLAGTQFLGDGRTAPFDYGVGRNSITQQGGDGVDVALERTLAPSAGRRSAFAYIEHELDGGLLVYVQGLYGRADASYDKDPNYMSGSWAGEVFVDNAYLPEDVRQRMISAGVESFPFSRYASPRDLTVARVDARNDTFSVTTGLKGDLGPWRLDAYYQYGTNNQEIDLTGNVRIDRVYRALDSVRGPTGEIICRSTLTFPDDGCIPTSFFGDGAVSDEAKAWLLDDNAQTQELTQHYAEVALDGEPFSTWSGPASVAFGGSWRYDEYDLFSHPYTRAMTTPTDDEAGYRGLPAAYSSNYPLQERAVAAESRGKSNVGEIFAEAIVPLIAGAPLIQGLDLQAALRYASYENSGGIWAWKGGLDWTVSREFRIRTTYSRDVRAGTLSELFDVGGRGATATDPFIEGRPTYAFVQVEGGNQAVEPERADTFTGGVVYRPSWARGLSASADYYDIQIEDAIAQLGVQSIIDSCFEGEEAYCRLIARGETGLIQVVRNTFLNIDAARTRGVDIELLYQTPVDLLGGAREAVELRGLASVYLEASTTPLRGRRIDRVGQTGPGAGLPDYRLLLTATYQNGGFTANLTGTHISEGVYNIGWIEGVDINDNSVDGAWYANLRIARDFELSRGSIEAYLSVTNLFDQEPPIAPTLGGGFFGTTHAPSVFDRVGRAYALGLRWRY